MPLQYVGGKTFGFPGTTSQSSTPLSGLSGGIGTSAQAGDIVVVAYEASNPADITLQIGANLAFGGYTTVADLYSNDSSDTNLSVAYRVITGSGDSNVHYSETGNVNSAGAIAIHVWRGVDTSSPIDVAVQKATGVNGGVPDPPPITPITSGAIILAVGGAASSTYSLFTSGQLSNFITAVGNDTVGAMIGLGSYAWSSGAFNPAAFGGGSTLSSASWAAVTLALRPAATATTQTLTPSLFTNSNSFYVATVAPGQVTLSPVLVDTQAALYAPTVAPQSITLSPDRLDNASALYAPAVATGAWVLTPPLLSGAAAVYAPAVVPGSVTISPDRLDGGQAFHGAAVMAKGSVLLPPPLSSSNAFSPPAVLRGSVTLQAPLIASQPAIYWPGVRPVTSLGPVRLANTQSFPPAAVLAGPVLVAPQLLAASQGFPGAVLRAGAVALHPGLFGPAQEFYASTVKLRAKNYFGAVLAAVTVDRARSSAQADRAVYMITVDAAVARIADPPLHPPKGALI